MAKYDRDDRRGAGGGKDRSERSASTSPDLNGDEFAILGRYLGLGAGFLADKTEIAEKVKSWFNAQFGGKEDSFLAIEMLTALSPLIPGGRFTDEILENFVRYSGHAIREYGRDGKRDPDMLQKRLEFAKNMAIEDGSRQAQKRDFFTALAALPPDDFTRARLFMYKLRDDEVERDLPDGTMVFVYDHLQKVGREREVQPEQLRAMIAHLCDMRGEEALEEAMRIVHEAPLLKSAPKAKQPTVVDKVMAGVEKFAGVLVNDVEEVVTGSAKPKTVSHTVIRGDSFASLETTYKVTERSIRSLNEMNENEPLVVGRVLTIPVLNEFFSKLDQRATKRAALLG